jgi:dTDP-4-dehydrorhamnose reductase
MGSQPWWPRLGVRHAKLAEDEGRMLARDAWMHHVTSRGWLYDAKASAKYASARRERGFRLDRAHDRQSDEPREHGPHHKSLVESAAAGMLLIARSEAIPLNFEKSTRVYIAGAGGMLGKAVFERFSALATIMATDIDVNESWLSYADVRVFSDIARSVRDFRPDVVLNLAALTDLEYCERHEEDSYLTNALGAENVGLVANELNIPYVYISTAGIFGGEKDGYGDFDAPNPLCIYAKSKLAGEQWVVRSVRKHFVVRAGWMMGGGPSKDKKFINKIYKQLATGKRVLHVVDDKLGCPTYTCDFAAGLQKLLESDLFGLYNQAGAGSGSRFDVAKEFVRLLKLADAVRIERVDSTFFTSDYFAPRPASEKLLNTKLQARGLNVMRDWKECLAEYVREFPPLRP